MLSQYALCSSGRRLLVTGALLTAACSSVLADLSLETETARVLKPGQFECGSAFEFQTAFDGKEYAVPQFFEFGVLPHVELLIEPVALVVIRPTPGQGATDIGDLETTLTYLVLDEKKYIPAIALGGEIKFPTATNFAVGSGEYDYRIYGILSKRIKDVEIHFNLGYNIIGSPPGVATKNPLDYELAVEWFVNPRFDLFAEVNRTESAVGRSGKGPSPAVEAGLTTPEVAPRETVGTVGARFHVSPHLDVFGTVSYDNSDAKLFRTGFTLKFDSFGRRDNLPARSAK